MCVDYALSDFVDAFEDLEESDFEASDLEESDFEASLAPDAFSLSAFSRCL
jgi:hypothetical protein